MLALATLTAEIILVTLEAKMASMVHRVTLTQQRQICRKSRALLGEATPELGEQRGSSELVQAAGLGRVQVWVLGL